VARRGVLRNRSFLILLSGQWVSQIGNVLFQMAAYWWVLTATGSHTLLGVVGGAFAAAALFSFVGGAFVDRWDRRRTMILADLVRALLALVLALLLALHLLGVLLLILLLVALAIAGSFFTPAELAFLPTLVAPEDLAAANGLNQSAGSLAQLIGAGLGGTLLALLGPFLLFLLNGLSFLASVLSLGLIPTPLRAAPPASAVPGSRLRNLLQEVLFGQRLLWHHPFLRRALPLALLVNLALMPVNVLDVAWVRQVLHLGAFAYAAFGIAILLGMLASGGVAASALRLLSPRRAGVLGLLTMGAAILILSRLPVLLPDLLALLVFGFAVGLVNVAFLTAIQEAVPSTLMGRVGGALITASGLANPVGALLAGALAAALPLASIFAGTGVLLILGGLGFLTAPDRIAPIDAEVSA
jgi:DHA3 family macrolide efflux protein-like MFS transporter